MVRACQHGFIRGKSCTSNLLEVLDHDGKQVDMIYMYMSEAFDKVNHGCLLQKFHDFGFGGSLLQWFSSCLISRYQGVTVIGETSDTLAVSSGIPQGSILGPMLFLIYVNNLPDSACCHFAMFADETKIRKQLSLRKRLHERGFKSSRFYALETVSKTIRFQS